MSINLRHRLASPAGFSIAIFAAALLARIFSFVLFPHPAYPDAFYYTAAARELAAGHGLTIPYLWSFIEVGSHVPANAVLPLPAFAHWMPLASLIQVPFIWALGPTDLASALPFLLLGAALAPLTYFLGRDLLNRERTARSAGILAATGVGLAPFLSQPDNFALYGILAIGSLWLVARTLRGVERPYVTLAAAGVLAGLAMLSRSDGLLLFVAVGLLWLFGRPWRRGVTLGRISTRGLIVFGLAGIIVVAPWFAHQLAIFGSLWPSSASGRILFIRQYGEMFSADGPLNLDYLLSWGIGSLVQSRLVGLGLAAFLWSVYLTAVVLTPLAILGAWIGRRTLMLRPWFAWIAIFWLWSGLVAAPHLLTGNFIHSVGAILPITLLLIVVGFEAIMAFVARHLPHWDAEAGTRRFLAGLVALAIILGAISSAKAIDPWSSQRNAYSQVSAYLDSHGPADARVMSADPGAIWIITGHPGIQTPDSGPAITEAALRSYDIRWVVLDSHSIVPTLGQLMAGKTTYPFLSAKPVFTVPDTDPTAGYPRLAVYAVLPVAP
jgi:4-amino-4-deoxy-L-arabinose transferase-like glycosyltransferase